MQLQPSEYMGKHLSENSNLGLIIGRIQGNVTSISSYLFIRNVLKSKIRRQECINTIIYSYYNALKYNINHLKEKRFLNATILNLYQ